MKYRRILIVPGFCEPRWLLVPIRRALRRCAPDVTIWHDSLAFRTLDTSVERLREAFEDSGDDGPIAIVTHSFGDWLARQAIAASDAHQIEALASVTPVVTKSPMAVVLRALGGGCISEVPVMADSELASEHARLDPEIRRLVIWASADAWVRRSEIPDSGHVEVRNLMATHLSVVLQPNVHHEIHDFLMRGSETTTVWGRESFAPAPSRLTSPWSLRPNQISDS